MLILGGVTVAALWLSLIPNTPTVYDQFRAWGQAVIDIREGNWLHRAGSSVSRIGKLGPLGRWLVQAPLAVLTDEYTLPTVTVLLALATMWIAWRYLRHRHGDYFAAALVLLVAGQPMVWVWTRFGFDFAFLPAVLWWLWRATGRAEEPPDRWRAGVWPAVSAAVALQIHSTAWPVTGALLMHLLARRPRAGLTALATAALFGWLMLAQRGPSPWGTPVDTFTTAIALIPPTIATWAPHGLPAPLANVMWAIGAAAAVAALSAVVIGRHRRLALAVTASLLALGFDESLHYHHVAHLGVLAALCAAALAARLADLEWKAVAWLIVCLQAAAVGITEYQAGRSGYWTINMYPLRPDLIDNRLPTLAAHRALLDALDDAGLTSATDRGPRLIGDGSWLHVDPGLVRLRDVTRPTASAVTTQPTSLWWLHRCGEAAAGRPVFADQCLLEVPAPNIPLQGADGVTDLVSQRAATWARFGPTAAFPPRVTLGIVGSHRLMLDLPQGWAIVPVWIHFPDFRVPAPKPLPPVRVRGHMMSMGARRVTDTVDWGLPLADLVPVPLPANCVNPDAGLKGELPCVSP